jgi:multidrug efflux pump subunit AcrB
VAQSLRDRYKGYTKGKFLVVELSGGPPAGADVQINLLGDDLRILDSYANQIVAFLSKQKGITNIDKSIKPGTSKIVFVPDKVNMAEVGVTPDTVGLWLRTYATGFTLESVRLGKNEDDIVLRTNEYDEEKVQELSLVQIPTATGGSVPLLSLGKFRLETNPTVITRQNEKRTISVAATVTKGYTIPEKNAELLDYVKRINFQEGYSYETGGVNEENQKSVNSILQAMVLAFMLILITMVIEFGSFRQAFIAITIIPISIAGVFYIFALTRTPLSFAALIGVLALFGIVVTHAIVVIEKINDNRAHGLPLKDAITDAAANRLEPVLLTSLATIAGLLPITIADPFWRGLGGAIIAVLIFSGALKLFFVPVLYYNFFKSDEDPHTQN